MKARSTWLPHLLIAILAVVLLAASGVEWALSLRLTAVVAVQAATGAYWWRLMRAGHRTPTLECIGMGLALGTAGAMLCGVIASPLPTESPVRGWAWALPTMAALIAWAIRRRRGQRLAPSNVMTRPQAAALALGGLLGLASLIVNLANYPLTWIGVRGSYHPDMLFFEALSTSMSRFGPSDSIFMAGADLRYHWFAYAWAGQVTEAAGAAPFAVLTRVLPLVALLGTLALAIAWSSRMSRVPWVPAVAAVLIVSGGYVGATYGTILNFDSPSIALTTVWVLALSITLLAYLRSGARWPLLIAIAVLGASVTGGKISSAIVIAGGFCLVPVVGFARRSPWRFRALTAAVVSLATLIVTYLLVISGSAESGGLGFGQLLNKASSVQGLNPVDTPRGIAVGTLVLVIAMAPRWAGLVWLVAAKRSRWHASTLFGVGLAAAAVATVLLVSGGMNDTWFALAASAPLSVLSAVGIGRAVQAVAPSKRPWPRPIIWVAVMAGALLSMLVTLLWATGASGPPSLRWLGPLAGVVGAVAIGAVLARNGRLSGSSRARTLALTLIILVVLAAPSRLLGLAASSFGVNTAGALNAATFSPFLPFVESIDRLPVTAWSSDQVAAASWLDSAAGASDIVATNITYSPLVPALVGRRMYVADIMHQAPYGRPGQQLTLLDRERDSWGFIDSPSAATVSPLCAAGVAWLWVDPERTGIRDWEPYATLVVEKPDVFILKVNPSACR